MRFTVRRRSSDVPDQAIYDAAVDATIAAMGDAGLGGNAGVTIASLVVSLHHAQRMLNEKGRPDLAANAHFIVLANGELALVLDPIPTQDPEMNVLLGMAKLLEVIDREEP